jgi:hypothetical protein
MNQNIHRICVWSMLIMVSLFTVGTVLAGIFPPPSPLRTASQVANYLNDNLLSVRVGYIFGMMGAGFIIPFAPALAWEVKKMANGGKLDGTGNDMAANVQLIGAFSFGISIFFPFLVFMASAFRPMDDIMVTQGLYDLAWLMFAAPVSVGTAWMLFLGIAMLLDSQPVKTFPRWWAYYTLFVAFDFLGGGFCVLTKTGPFAWDGILTYWIPFGTWGMWSLGMTYYMNKAVSREYAHA